MAKKSTEDTLREQLAEAEAKIEALTAEAGESKRAAWREADYTGPLTGDQAAWRHANIKPVQDVVTK